MLRRTQNSLSLWIAVATAVGLRFWFLFAHRIDSDEPQHLHVAWAWTQGLVPYRDVFDNHLPLLHAMFAPVMALAPESSEVFTFMRLAIAPIAIACGWLIYELARPMIGSHAASIAAVLFSVLPVWLPKSVEFRNDTLWIFFWLAGLALLSRPRKFTPFWAGFAFALSLLASIKTIPLILAHLLAMATTRRSFTISQALRMTAGFAVPLTITAAAFALIGALDDMIYGTLLFNAAAPVSAARRIGGALAFLILAPMMLRLRNWKHLWLVALWYTVVLLCFWPILTPRDFLPLAPIAAIWIAPHLNGHRWQVAVVAASIMSVWYARIWRNDDAERHRFLDAAVSMTAEADYVFDLKGDAVFRRRPVYFVYEDVGRALTTNGTIVDDGPEQIIAKGSCVAVQDSAHVPPRTRAFLREHFIDVGALRVCGENVTGSAFEIAVPQTYAVVARDPARVVIDGKPYRGPRHLNAGRHTLSRNGNDRATIVWWRAAREDLW